MRQSLMNPTDDDGHWDPKFPFDLVIAYEDTATRNRAMRLHDHLARQLEDDFDLQCAWWKFDHLADPTLGEQAVDDAVSADMIVLSVHPGTELSPDAQRWIDGWSHRRDHRKCALVTLFAEAGAKEAGSPVFTRLRQVARQARMDFFTNISRTAGAAAEFTVEQVAERARALTPTLEDILHRPIPVPRWGINES